MLTDLLPWATDNLPPNVWDLGDIINITQMTTQRLQMVNSPIPAQLMSSGDNFDFQPTSPETPQD